MIKLFRALKAENIKLWSKLSTKLFLILPLVLSLVLAVCVRSLGGYEQLPSFFDSGHAARAVQRYEINDNWVAEGENNITQWVARMEQLSETIENRSGYEKYTAQREYDALLREASIMRYRIDKMLKPGNCEGWDNAVFVFWISALLMLPLYLVLVSDMFAGEYTRGTIRTMLPRPVTRIKQYIAKQTSAMLYAALMLAIVMATSLASGAVACSGLGDPVYIGWFSNGVLHSSRAWLMLMLYICVLAAYAVVTALCAAAGNLTRSRAASAAVSFCTAAISWLLGEAICAGGSKIAGVSIFAVLDLSVPLTQIGNCAGIGFNTCVVCVAAYYVLFSFLGYSFFKKDV